MGRLALDVAEQQGVDACRCVAARTRLALLGTEPSAIRRHGLQTAASTSPTVSRSPACSTATGMPCARARRSTASADGAGSRTGPTSSWTTRAPADGAAEPVDVVGVEVGEDDGVEGRDPQAAQAAVDQRRVGAGVDEDRPVRAAAQDDGVTLADVARRRRATRRAAR